MGTKSKKKREKKTETSEELDEQVGGDTDTKKLFFVCKLLGYVSRPFALQSADPTRYKQCHCREKYKNIHFKGQTNDRINKK